MNIKKGIKPNRNRIKKHNESIVYILNGKYAKYYVNRGNAINS